MVTCMAVRHTLVWRMVYFLHSTQTCRNSVLLIGGAMPQSTPLPHPQGPRPHSPSPAIFLLRCNHLNLNPFCSEVEVFSWEWFCLSLRTPGHFTVSGDFRVDIHGRQSCSVGAVCESALRICGEPLPSPSRHLHMFLTWSALHRPGHGDETFLFTLCGNSLKSEVNSPLSSVALRVCSPLPRGNWRQTLLFVLLKMFPRSSRRFALISLSFYFSVVVLFCLIRLFFSNQTKGSWFSSGV